MHLYLKYQSPNTFGSKDITQVKVFQNYVKVQTRSKVLVQNERSLHEVSICEISESIPFPMVQKI
jgi:hypothetical protein